MQCPKCNSDNTQRLELVFDSGYHEYESDNYGDYGGESISNLAKKAAPPSKLHYRYPLLLLIFAIWLIINSNILQFLIATVSFCAGVYGIFLAWKFNRNKWPIEYQRWKRQWFCHRCGTKFD